jgi:hypothetical protein
MISPEDTRGSITYTMVLDVSGQYPWLYEAVISAYTLFWSIESSSLLGGGSGVTAQAEKHKARNNATQTNLILFTALSP